MEWAPSRRFDGMSKGHGGGTEVEVGLPSRGRRGLSFFNQINPRHPLQLASLTLSLASLLLQHSNLQACFSPFCDGLPSCNDFLTKSCSVTMHVDGNAACMRS
jgi:hypothetical protein